ncbi:MAG: response regulator [Alicyclobacillus sp.]|nr:response regulator [Alicyclobacillus sp.]
MRIRTLLVDDSPETLDALSLLYATNPMIDVVGRTNNATETLSFLDSVSVDLVSLDIHLGSDNGLQLCSQINERHPSVFVSICSLEEDEEYRAMARLAGAKFFLPKPVTFDDIDQLIHEVRRLQTSDGNDSVAGDSSELNWMEQVLKQL